MRLFRKTIFWLVVSCAVRVLLITRLPIFNDEAIYLHWGTSILSGRYPWFFPVVTDGKPPLSMIIFALASLAGGDPLLGARLVSVLVSGITLVLLLWITRHLLGKENPPVLALMLITCPYLLMFDRMALAESMVTATYVLALAAYLKLRESYGVIWAIVLGCVLGVGWWIKTSVLAAVPVIAVFGAYDFYTRQRQRLPITKALGIALVCFAIIAAPLRFHPSYAYVSAGEGKWMYTVPEILSFPVRVWFRNSVYMISWFIAYLTPPVFLAALAGATMIFRHRQARFILIAAVIPMGIELVMAKAFTARYPVLVVPWMLALAYIGLRSLPGKLRAISYTCVIAVSAVSAAIQMISPTMYYRMLSVVPYAASDYRQYVAGFTSGYGIRETVTWFGENRKNKPTIVFVRQDSGNPEDAMFVYLGRMKNVRVGYLNNTYDYGEYKKVTAGFPGDTFYFVSRGGAFPQGMQPYMTEITRFGKPIPGDSEYVGIYAVKW